MDARAEALERLKAKRKFQRYAVIYAVAIAFFVAIWALTNRGGYFWPIWPALGARSLLVSALGRPSPESRSPTPISRGRCGETPTHSACRTTPREPRLARGRAYGRPRVGIAWDRSVRLDSCVGRGTLARTIASRR